tara:strand:+ start:242 stop:751 length:510 start_codon:yes stop_codon:yes gene_type:complete
MNNKDLFALIDSLAKDQGEMSKTPMGREVLYVMSPSMNKTGTRAPEGVDIQELIRGMLRSDSPIKSQFSSMLGRNQLKEKPSGSKSIDDILRQSNISEFLSKIASDKTNVDVSKDTEIAPSNIGRMDRKTLQELLKMQEPVPQDTSGIGRMDINTLIEIMRMQEPTPRR